MCARVCVCTCPGVIALMGWESVIHSDPSMLRVTVQGAGEQPEGKDDFGIWGA